MICKIIINILNSFTWNCRTLQSITDGENTYSYKYNGDGQRISKTVNGVETEYYYNGSTLAGQKTGDEVLSFMYDENGVYFGFIYNGEDYYFIKNVQNDVEAISDKDENIVVRYTYDAWGNVNEISGSKANTLGKLNPIRYRGYYYDSETNLYYLRSRYYSPEMCRFINADGYVQTGQSLLDKNMFAYCLNNPVNMVDSDGNSSALIALCIIFFGAIAGGIAGAFYDGDMLGNARKSREEQKKEEQKSYIPNIPTTNFNKKTDKPSSKAHHNKNQVKKNTRKIKISNIVVGAAGGMIVSAGVVIVAGAVITVTVGPFVGAPIAAVGMLAYNIYPMILAPVIGMEAEPIEWQE